MSPKPDRFFPEQIIERFDLFLSSKGIRFEAIIIGSGALSILKIIERLTTDIDVLEPEIPKNIHAFADEFRVQLDKEGLKLKEDWLNNGPKFLLKHLPNGWRKRLKTFFKGKALTLHTLGRDDLIKDKLWGYCDLREHDLEALLSLKPNESELKEAYEWVLKQHNIPFWPETVEKATRSIAEKLGHESFI